jgi:hypothetical protein
MHVPPRSSRERGRKVLHMTQRRKRVDRGIARLQKSASSCVASRCSSRGAGGRETGRHIERLVKTCDFLLGKPHATL